MKYYFLIDDTGEIILSSLDKEVIEAKRDDCINKDINKYAEEEELDVDDMTQDEFNGVVRAAADANYEIGEVEIPDNYDENETFIIFDEEYTFNDVLSVLDEEYEE